MAFGGAVEAAVDVGIVLLGFSDRTRAVGVPSKVESVSGSGRQPLVEARSWTSWSPDSACGLVLAQ